jgi:DNA replication protein DnaC
MSAAFYSALVEYGVPLRITKSLAEYFELPPPYSIVPRELPTLKRPWLYVHGPAGTGKSTYAAWLLALWLRASTRLGSDEQAERLTGMSRTTFPALYVRVGELLHRMKADFDSKQGDGAALFERCLAARFLVLDDLTNAPSPWELSKLDLLIDKRYGDESATIITSNHALDQLGKIVGSERIQRRIQEAARPVKRERKLR